MYARTYKDNLRLLASEQKEEPVVEAVDPFAESIVNISDEDVEPIGANMLYRAAFSKLKHSYVIKAPDANYVNRKEDKFADLADILPALIPDCCEVDTDFLTGYYLASVHMNLPYVLTSFHAGISNDSLTKGIYFALAKREKKTKWQMLGCDAKPTDMYKSILYNGIKKPCDIYDSNTRSSINIQLSEAIDVMSVNVYTCDINSSSTAELIKQFTLIKDYLTMDAFILLRLPANWTTKYTSMSTFLLFCVSNYRTVKIFKTPWGATPKNYLLLHKRKLNTLPYTYLNSYVNTEPNAPLINQTYFNINDQDSIMKRINDAYVTIMSQEVTYTKDVAIQLYSGLVESKNKTIN